MPLSALLCSASHSCWRSYRVLGRHGSGSNCDCHGPLPQLSTDSMASLLQTKAKYGVSMSNILKATLRREMTLINRLKPMYIFRFCQVRKAMSSGPKTSPCLSRFRQDLLSRLCSRCWPVVKAALHLDMTIGVVASHNLCVASFARVPAILRS